MARLSPRAVKKAAKIATSSLLHSLEIAIAVLLAKATSSQFEKSETHKKLTSNKLYEVSIFLVHNVEKMYINYFPIKFRKYP